MLKEIVLNGVKTVAKNFLYLPIEVDHDFPFIIHHPIFSNSYMFNKNKEAVNIVEDPDGLLRIQKGYEEMGKLNDLDLIDLKRIGREAWEEVYGVRVVE